MIVKNLKKYDETFFKSFNTRKSILFSRKYNDMEEVYNNEAERLEKERLERIQKMRESSVSVVT